MVHDARMSGDQKVTERLVAQRMRNRIMEEIWGLSKADVSVQDEGPAEWFESFFDYFPYEGEPDWYPAMTPEESIAVREVCRLMQQAVADADIPRRPTVEDIVRTHWPRRIAPVAKQAVDLMMQRGRFSEETEEDEPSNRLPWP